MPENNFIDANPNPEYLIKSIAEQGYSLETALADLIDNSISADADLIEIITDINDGIITLYIADNGNGMSLEELKKNMEFPSNSIDATRLEKDLGRFGLGMKTASFSQTRKFTTITREKNIGKYNAATWDVKYLKTSGKWRIIINNELDVKFKLLEFNKSSNYLNNHFDNFKPNTIIIWEGLYKFQNYIETKNLENAFFNEINNTVTEHLGIVFHKFIDNSIRPLKIKINNNIVKSFDPFPKGMIRPLEMSVKKFGDDVFKIQGFVIPISATENEKSTVWVNQNKGLSDLEGIYIYRGGRIISYGGWSSLIKRLSHLKLARIRIEVGNSNDDKLQLNVSKSGIIFPYEYKIALLNYLSELNLESKKEWLNPLPKKVLAKNKDNKEFLNKIHTTKGLKVEINLNFPLLKILTEELNPSQFSKLKMVLKTINNQINKIKHIHDEKEMIGIEEKDGVEIKEVIDVIKKLILAGMNRQKICDSFLNGMGFTTNNLPDEIEQLFK